MDTMKRQKDISLQYETPHPRLEGVQHATGGQLLTAQVRMKWLGQSRNNTQLWMYLVVKSQV